MKTKLVGLMFLICASAASAQIAHLTFTSDPGDFIGQGQTRDIYYTPPGSLFFSAQIRREVSGQPAELLFTLGDLTPLRPIVLLSFGTDALGIPMQDGLFINAERADFATAGHPGLDVSFDHRGSNTLSGFFTVHDFLYDSFGIEHFSADFEQHSERAVPALRGSFEYSSASFLAAVPEPGTYGTAVAIFLLGIAFMRRRKIG